MGYAVLVPNVFFMGIESLLKDSKAFFFCTFFFLYLGDLGFIDPAGLDIFSIGFDLDPITLTLDLDDLSVFF